MQIAWLLFPWSAIAGSCVVAAAGWRLHQLEQAERRAAHRRRLAGHPPNAVGTHTAGARSTETGAAAGAMNVSALLPEILTEFHPLLVGRGAHVDVAIQSALTADFDRDLFRSVLPVMLDSAVRATSDGNLLVTAMRFGGWVQIVVSDDGVADDRAAREGDLRASSHLVAMRGGSLDVDTRRGEGTTTTLRLPVSVAGAALADPLAEQATSAPLAF